MVHSQRVYLESTVWYQLANYTSSEFKERAEQLLGLVSGNEFSIFISAIVLEELTYNSKKYRTRVESLLRKHKPTVVIPNHESETLAQAYIENAFADRKQCDVIVDALHAAIATSANTAYVASYNYRNLLNVQTMAHINAVNLIAGLNRQIAILPPFMFLRLDDYHGETGEVDRSIWEIKSKYGKELLSILEKEPPKRREYYESIASRAEKKLRLQVVRLTDLEI
jgi:predicted nucleic acid-binding protein